MDGGDRLSVVEGDASTNEAEEVPGAIPDALRIGVMLARDYLLVHGNRHIRLTSQ